MSKFFFEDFFSDRGSLQSLCQGCRHLPDQRRRHLVAAASRQEARSGARRTRGQEPSRAGRRRPTGATSPIYSGEPTAAATDASHPVSPKLVIREITYDTGLARQAVLQVFLSSMVVLALLLPLVFWIASRLLQKQLLDPLFNLRGEAGAIAEGDLDQAIANTERSDEIGQLAKSFASMRDAVRRTILDLKDTNISIERFVPHAFLAIIGKPSIVEVELGDNKRQNMTRAVLRHPELHDAVGEDDAGREFRLHQRLSGAHGAGHPRPQRLHRQVYRRRHHGPVRATPTMRCAPASPCSTRSTASTPSAARPASSRSPSASASTPAR